MLTRKNRVLWRFTGVNSHFLSHWRNCKHATTSKNYRFGSPPSRLKTQTLRCFQCRILGCQITIFSFLDAQLDFLAIFFTLPYFYTKETILSDSSQINICQKLANTFYLSWFCCIYFARHSASFFYLKNSKTDKNPQLNGISIC